MTIYQPFHRYRGSASPTTSPVVLLTPAAALVAPSARPTGGATNNDPKEATWETTWNYNRWPVKPNIRGFATKHFHETSCNGNHTCLQGKVLTPWNFLSWISKKIVHLLERQWENWSEHCEWIQGAAKPAATVFPEFTLVLQAFRMIHPLPFAYSNLQLGGSKPPQGTWMN